MTRTEQDKFAQALGYDSFAEMAEDEAGCYHGRTWVSGKVIANALIDVLDIPPERDCRICGGDGWTDGSAELRAERGDRSGDTTCVGCNGTGKEEV
jgi:hypothetical protein